MSATRTLTIQPVNPKGAAVRLELLGDSDLNRNGGGGWQIVDRPRRQASTEWIDYNPFQMTLPLMLDGFASSTGTLKTPASIEPIIAQVEAWEKNPSGTLEPPRLKVTGPVPHNDLLWVVKSLAWGAAIRSGQGTRQQQELNLVLLEYVPPRLTLTRVGAAASAVARSAASSTGPKASLSTYTVQSGDTLTSIAAKRLGDYRRWTDIATLNKIRDPRSLRAGQTLSLPA
jgi:hypothetical protein